MGRDGLASSLLCVKWKPSVGIFFRSVRSLRNLNTISFTHRFNKNSVFSTYKTCQTNIKTKMKANQALVSTTTHQNMVKIMLDDLDESPCSRIPSSQADTQKNRCGLE